MAKNAIFFWRIFISSFWLKKNPTQLGLYFFCHFLVVKRTLPILSATFLLREVVPHPPKEEGWVLLPQLPSLR